MTLIILSNIIFTWTITMLLSNNPMVLGLSILLLALLVAMMFAISLSSWFAFLIFLIYVGGMLVMFSYFIALIPNQSQMTTYNMAALLLSSFVLIKATLINNLTLHVYSHPANQVMVMYTPSNMFILVMLALTLFFTMIIVVKVTKRTKGPLRAFMAYV